jgi:hypothetical protein
VSCSACKGRCRAPQACHQAEPGPPPPERRKTFRTNYGITGPHRQKRLRVPEPWRSVALVLVLLVVLLATVVFPVIHRFNT